MRDNLTQIAAKGVMWAGISQFSTQAFQFIVTIILARLLIPSDFGIVSMAATFTGFVVCINRLGFNAAIVQKKEITEKHLSTAFWSCMFIAVILYILTIIISPFIAVFFRKEIVRPVVCVVAIGFITGALGAVQRSLFSKQLDFKSLAIVEIGIAIAYGASSIFLALMDQGVWSLVYGGIFSDVIGTLLLWLLCNWRPKLIFDYKSFKELFSFGIYVTGENVVNYISANIDYILVGRFIGAHFLGVYTVAYTLITFPRNKISNIVTRVTFPLFSSIQDDNKRLQNGYLAAIKYISIITFPATIGLLIIAPEFVMSVYGEKWQEVAIPLRIMCIAGMLKSIGTTVGSVLYAKNRADIGFKWNLIELSILTLSIIIAIKYGIVGVAIAVTLTTVLLEPIIQWITNKLIELRFADIWRALRPASICSFAMSCSLLVYNGILQKIINLSDFGLLISSIAIGIMVYLLLFKKYFNPLFNEMANLFRFI